MSGGAARDRQRRQVYCAEDLASESTALDQRQELYRLARVVGEVVVSSWWTAVGGGRRLEVVLNQSEQRSYWDPRRRRLSLSPGATNLATVTHELAHTLVTDTGAPGWRSHGPEFRGAHVLVRQLVLGSRCGTDLSEVYQQFGLVVDATPWTADFGVPTRPVLDPSWYDGVRIVGRPGHPAPSMPIGGGAIAL